ncbi:MAG TPA: hypothetical protein VHR66_27745 [Gemmataceae bacterium]|jgi:hypothetical protein|nr:hypothetical protein [Gemmataceae bacterium]
MAGERDGLRDWHRLFGLLLTDYFTDSPFVVEIERDLSKQLQLLDVVIVRRRPGKFAGRLPDGLEGLRVHNLITFKSHHEALDPWAIKELIGHSVAYRKVVSRSPSDLLPEDRFGLYAVAARFPRNLSSRVPWRQLTAGVYDCEWGTDTVRVVVAGELSREAHNAPLHLVSDRPALLEFGGRTYRPRSEQTSRLILQLYERFQQEGLAMPFTMEDFNRQFVEEHFARLTRREREQALNKLTPEERLAGLSAEQIRAYLDRLSTERPVQSRKARRKK